MTSRRPFLLLRISFPGRPFFIQFIPVLEELLGQEGVTAPGGGGGYVVQVQLHEVERPVKQKMIQFHIWYLENHEPLGANCWCEHYY